MYSTDDKKLLLRFLFSHENSIKYIRLLDKSIFDRENYKLSFEYLKKYITRYESRPTRETFSKFMMDSIKNKFDSTREDEIENLVIPELFTRVDNSDFVEDKVIEWTKKFMFENTLVDNFDEIIAGNTKRIDLVYSKLEKIINLNKSKELSGYFLQKDRDKINIVDIEGHPTFLSRLNSFTSAKGFHTPQVVIFMKGPKASGTLLLLQLAIGYLSKGLNVFYGDFENGKDQIMERFRQGLMKCTYDEVYEESSHFNRILDNFARFKFGELRVEEFNAYKDNLTNVEATLEVLKFEHNFKPDVVFLDYIDLIAHPEEKDKRLAIQKNYHGVRSLNKKLNTFTISISKITTDAFERPTYTIADFGEDREKAYNADAAFGLCRTPIEQYASLARIEPVMQRRGVGGNTKFVPCFLHMDDARQTITELSGTEYRSLLEEAEQDRNSGSGGKHLEGGS